MSRCAKCGEHLYSWERTHACAPKWHLWCPEVNGDDPYTVRGMDEEAAAERWVDGDSEDFGDGDSIVVLVAPLGEGPEKGRWIKVRAELELRLYTDDGTPSAEDLKALGLEEAAS